MSIDFHDPRNSKSYTFRNIDPAWQKLITSLVDLEDRIALDIGCGGGLYSNCLAQLGVQEVIGMDFSAEMLKTAEDQNRYPEKISFRQGNALDIPLENETIDFILERAVIHHIDPLDLVPCFKEAYRVLNKSGTFIAQDRTKEDCFLPGSAEHIRGYFFELFPHLRDIENKRRHASETVIKALREAGFQEIHEEHIWERRNEYLNLEQIREDLLSRKGRSLLHALSDQQLEKLIKHMEKKITHFPLIEKDRWTIWRATK